MFITYTHYETNNLTAFVSELPFCTHLGISYFNKFGASKIGIDQYLSCTHPGWPKATSWGRRQAAGSNSAYLPSSGHLPSLASPSPQKGPLLRETCQHPQTPIISRQELVYWEGSKWGICISGVSRRSSIWKPAPPIIMDEALPLPTQQQSKLALSRGPWQNHLSQEMAELKFKPRAQCPADSLAAGCPWPQLLHF